MNSKISKLTFVFMLIVAGIADAISFGLSIIPWIGWIVNPVFGFLMMMVFWVWFAFKGLGFHGAVGGGASAVVEFIPFIQALPSFTAMVVVIYIKTKGIEKVGKVAGHIGPAKKIAQTALKKAA